MAGSVAIEQATTLRDAVAAHLGPSHPFLLKARVNQWAGHIEKLTTQDKIPATQVADVLAWYVDHIGQQYVPQAFAGESFRKKFPLIAFQADKDPAGVEVSPAANLVVESLRMGNWPKGSAAQLPAAVQTSMDRYAVWRKRVGTFTKHELAEDKKLKPSKTGPDVLVKRRGPWGGAGRRILDSYGAPAAFIQAWFEVVERRVANWPDWNGDLTPFVFDPKSKQFMADLADVCTRWGACSATRFIKQMEGFEQ